MFAQTCEAVRPAALAYFQQRTLTLTTDPGCTECYAGTTGKLHDDSGHRLFSNRNAINKYTRRDLRDEKIGPVTQIIHTDLKATANLRLHPAAEGTCKVSLRFEFTYFGAELILGFPADGHTLSASSNGKLEAAYLETLQQQIDRAALAKR